MAQSYTRQSTFADGDTISASLFNNEYNQLLNSFAYSSTSAVNTGHRHDGTAGQGGNIFKIGDLDFLNKIEVDGTNNRLGFYVEVSSAAVEQVRIQDGVIVPVTDNDIDLGTSSLQFKDLYINGTANLDSLVLGSGSTVTAILDEDDLSSDSATSLATQQSIKAYVDAQVTAQDFDFSADSGGALSIDLDSEAMTFTGGTGIDTSGSGNAVTFAIDSTVATLADTQTFTNKTLTSPDINGGTVDGATIATSDITVGAGKTLDVSAGTLTLADDQISGDKVEGGTIAATTITDLTFGSLNDGTITVTAFVDEDNMSSDSATLVPTQQSVKAYVDAQVTAQDLDVTTDSGTIAIDLDSENLTVTGGTGIDSSATGNAVTLAIDSTVATLAGSQTLSNKTLTTPVVSGNLTTDGLIDGRDVATDGTKLDTIESNATADQTDAEIKTAYENNSDTNAFTDAEKTKLSGIEASADVTDTANVTAAGALMDSELTSEASVKALDQGVATTDSPAFTNLTLNGTGSVKVPAGTTAQRDGSPAAGMFRYNSSLAQFEGYTDDWGAIGGGGTNTFTTDSFTGNGSTTAYALSQSVSSEDNLLVFIEGVFQQQDAYSIATAGGVTTLTFSVAPANSNSILIYSVAAGVSGSNLNIDSMTGDGSDTTLTLTINPVNENNTQVFIDGVYQNKSTYSISGTTLTFSTAPPNGSAVEVMTMTQTDINVPVDGTITSAKLSGDLTLPGDLSFADNNKAIFGAGSDLQIYHDGSHSYVSDQGTGDLRILAADFRIRNAANDETMIQANSDTDVSLWYNNSKKLATTNTGIDVTGTVVSDGATIDGTLELNSNSFKHTALTPSYNFIESDVTGENTQFLQASGTLRIRTVDDSVANPVERFRIDHSTGDISFYNSSGTSQSLHWDSSAESLGIGTSSPSAQLSIYNSSSATFEIGTSNAQNSTSNITMVKGYDGECQFDMRTYANSDPASRIRIAGTEALYIEADPENTYANSDIIFTTDGSEAMRIDASGNVGIGTSSPSHPLTIQGSGASGNAIKILGDSTNNSGRILWRNSADSSGTASISVNSSEDMVFGTGGGTERMRIDASGNVGIGTSSPSSTLHLSASSPIITLTDSDTGAVSSISASSGEGSLFIDADSGNAVANTSMRFRTDGSERMRIDSSGNVGIGTSPSTTLEIANTGNGTAGPILRLTNPDVTMSSNQGIGAIEFFNSDATGLGARVATNIQSFAANTSGGGYLTFGVSPNAGTVSEAMRIGSSGNLLVGTTAANFSISSEVMDGFGVSGSGKFVTIGVNNNYCLALQRNGSDGIIQYFFNDTASAGNISVSGSTVTYNTSSDQRLKENIADADDAGSKIDAIQVRKFDWIADGAHQDYGMVAQELQTVAPEAVSGDADSDEMMGVDYSKLVPMLVKEIQSLRSRVQQLENN